MRGVSVLHGRMSIVDDLAVPPVAAGQVMVRVEACGICGSDLSLYKGAENFVEVARSADYALAQFDTDVPVTPGHEFAGVVMEVADDVTGFAVGDRVTGIGVVTDAETGSMSIIGYSNTYPGGLSERVVVDASWLRHIPDSLDFDAAALAEPLHVGEMHVQQSGWDGQRAVIIGAGPIGLGVVVALHARGATDVTVVEPSRRRREVATALGAGHTVDPKETDLRDVLATMSEPVHVFECSGRQGALTELTRISPYGSHVQVAASAFKPESFVPVVAQFRMLTINFGSGPVDDPYGTTLQRLADGSVDPNLLITSRRPLDEVVDAFEALSAPDAEVKIIIHPQSQDPA